jgi:beta-galactosidase
VTALLLLAASASAQQAAPPAAAAQAAALSRLTLNFDNDWRFFKGEPPAPAATQPTGGNYPPVDPASHAYKDDAWRKVTLPHDWSIEGPFEREAPTMAAGAYLPSGVAWYRKSFTVPAEAKGKRVFIEFDGVMANSDVWINKGHLGQRPNGYVPFRYDLTDYLDFNGPNVIAVRTDTSRQPASRWYTGAGITRHVRLVVQNAVHLEHDATAITTPRIAADAALVQVRTRVTNQSAESQQFTVMATIHGPPMSAPDGRSGYAAESPVQTLAPGASVEVTIDAPMPFAPRLWSPEQPDLHLARVRVMSKGTAIDEEALPFGIRTAEFKADTGFWLNGKNIKLKGVCLHHDLGALGGITVGSAWESRLAELKKYGVNAIRAAHAPMPPEFYAACDKLGLLVMDEAFDVWTVGKEPGDYHLYFRDWWQRDLEAMVKAHRNHPSIVIWSLGNEIWDILTQNPDPALDQFTGPMRSIEIAKNLFVPMRELTHQLDPTRPVTIAQMRPNVNKTYDNGFADLMDVIGQNYRDAELAAAHRQKPTRKIIGTENYKTRESWLALRDNPALSGQFLWAGVDYLGEAGMWPNFTSPSGILDRTNAPKGEAFERRAWWSDTPVVNIVRMQVIASRPGRPNVNMGFADWTPENGEAHQETVNVYSNCDEVELFQDGKSLGVKAKNRDDAPRGWQVPYTAGMLRAVGRNQGKEVANDELRTAGTATKIKLVAERETLANDPDQVLYVRALVTDDAGIVNPNAAPTLKFSVSGPAAILATDNGSLNDHTPFASPERKALRGTCVAIVKATADTGAITIRASAEGLSEGSVTIQAAAGLAK